MSLSRLKYLVTAAYGEWSEDNASRLAAALSFYAALSLPPLLIIVLGIAGFVFGREAATGQLVAEMRTFFGYERAQIIQDIIASANGPASGLVSTIVGVIILLFGASGVFSALQDGLNTVWTSSAKGGRGLVGVIKDQFLSFAMVFGLGFLLLVSLVISTLLSALGENLFEGVTAPAIAVEVGNFILSFLFLIILFGLMYKILPDVEIGWNDVWIGALITALLFTLGKLGLGIYLGRSTFASAYGAAGSFVVILVWIYYSAQIVFFGAELTQV
ncbi:MAG TPA: YihY/virulence factor BrkB family protein [Blastocatellia bacterium]|nr:YihY/virulence factor BrkB family protein [Blastocatellia bacterium]